MTRPDGITATALDFAFNTAAAPDAPHPIPVGISVPTEAAPV